MRIDLERFAENPLIRPDMLCPDLAGSINGPSVLRVPGWIDRPLGRYYLYFAHHRGGMIELAYANDLHGPWRIHAPGVLSLEATAAADHVASPDIVVDEEARQIRLYFHGGGVRSGQRRVFASEQPGFVATSPDGLHFTAMEPEISPAYLRVFRLDGWYYAVAMQGALFRSRDGLGVFEAGPVLLPPQPGSHGTRHVAVLIRDRQMLLFYTNRGDAPESILAVEVDLHGDWAGWRAGPPQQVLRPEHGYEGADLPIAPSRPGMAKGRLHELRDPAVVEDAGRVFLFYAVAGEGGIAGAELFISGWAGEQ